MRYDKYFQKVEKAANIKNIIVKYRILIISIFVVLTAFLSFYIFSKGTIRSFSIDNEIQYGQKLNCSSSSLFSKSTFEFCKVGEDEWTTTTPENAGEYYVRVTSNGAFEKKVSEIKKLIISKRPLTISIASNSVIYGEKPVISCDNLKDGDYVYLADLAFNYDDLAQSSTNVCVNKESLVIKNSAGENVTDSYEIVNQTSVIDFNKKDISLIVLDDFKTKVYDGTPFKLNTENSFGLKEQLPFFDNFQIDSINIFNSKNEVIEEAILPGVYTYKINSINFNNSNNDVSNNYNVCNKDLYGTFEILKRKIKIETTSYSKVYDSYELTMATENDFYLAFDSPNNLLNGDSLVLSENSATPVIRFAGVIDNSLIVDVKRDNEIVSDYYDIEYAYGKLEINKKSINVSTNSESKIYDGIALANNNLNVDQLFPNEKYRVNETISITHVGSIENNYTITIYNNELSDEDNKKLFNSYDINYTYGSLTIKPRVINITINNLETRQYNGNIVKTTYKINDELVYGDQLEAIFKYYCNDEELDYALHAGIYKVKLYDYNIINGEKNDYIIVPVSDVSFEITPIKLEVSASDVTTTYNRNDFKYSNDFNISGQKLPKDEIKFNAYFKLGNDIVIPKNNGKYDIFVDEKNYEVLGISKKDDYKIICKNKANLTINKKIFDLTIDNNVITYGDKFSPTPEFNIDSYRIIPSYLFIKDNISYTNVKNVGTYIIDINKINDSYDYILFDNDEKIGIEEISNYDINLVKGIVVVNKFNYNISIDNQNSVFSGKQQHFNQEFNVLLETNEMLHYCLYSKEILEVGEEALICLDEKFIVQADNEDTTSNYNIQLEGNPIFELSKLDYQIEAFLTKDSSIYNGENVNYIDLLRFNVSGSFKVIEGDYKLLINDEYNATDIKYVSKYNINIRLNSINGFAINNFNIATNEFNLNYEVLKADLTLRFNPDNLIYTYCGLEINPTEDYKIIDGIIYNNSILKLNISYKDVNNELVIPKNAGSYFYNVSNYIEIVNDIRIPYENYNIIIDENSIFEIIPCLYNLDLSNLDFTSKFNGQKQKYDNIIDRNLLVDDILECNLYSSDIIYAGDHTGILLGDWTASYYDNGQSIDISSNYQIELASYYEFSIIPLDYKINTYLASTKSIYNGAIVDYKSLLVFDEKSTENVHIKVSKDDYTSSVFDEYNAIEIRYVSNYTINIRLNTIGGFALENFDIDVIDYTLYYEVLKANLTFKFNPKNVMYTYCGKEIIPLNEYDIVYGKIFNDSILNLNISYRNDQGELTTPKNVGTYYYFIESYKEIAGDEELIYQNYNIYIDNDSLFEIKPYKYIIKLIDQYAIFNGELQSYSYIQDDLYISRTSEYLSYRLNSSEIMYVEQFSEIEIDFNARDLTGDDTSNNYDVEFEEQAYFRITPLKYSVSLELLNNQSTYNGNTVEYSDVFYFVVSGSFVIDNNDYTISLSDQYNSLSIKYASLYDVNVKLKSINGFRLNNFDLNLSEFSFDYEVLKADLSIKFNPSNTQYTYNGEAIEPNDYAVVDGKIFNDNNSSLKMSPLFKLNNEDIIPIHVGTYKYYDLTYIEMINNKESSYHNYNVSIVESSFEIIPISLNVSANNVSSLYTRNNYIYDKKINISNNKLDSDDFKFKIYYHKVNNSIEDDIRLNNVSYTGEYKIYVDTEDYEVIGISNNDDYDIVCDSAATLIIGKKIIKVTIKDINTIYSEDYEPEFILDDNQYNLEVNYLYDDLPNKPIHASSSYYKISIADSFKLFYNQEEIADDEKNDCYELDVAFGKLTINKLNFSLSGNRENEIYSHNILLEVENNKIKNYSNVGNYYDEICFKTYVEKLDLNLNYVKAIEIHAGTYYEMPYIDEENIVIDGLGRYSDYEFREIRHEFVVSPIKIELSYPSLDKVYDGKAIKIDLSQIIIKNKDGILTGDLLSFNYKIYAKNNLVFEMKNVICDDYNNVLLYKITFEPSVTSDISLSDDYELTNPDYDVKILPRSIDVITGSVTTYYNGENVILNEFKLSDDSEYTLLDGQYFTLDTAKSTLSFKDVGIYNNSVYCLIKDDVDDLTMNYDINYSWGIINILKRKISITSSSKTDFYLNGKTPLQSFDYTIDDSDIYDEFGNLIPNGLAPNHNIIVDEENSSTLNSVGEINNILVFRIYDMSDIIYDLSYNYEIEYNYGELILLKRNIYIKFNFDLSHFEYNDSINLNEYISCSDDEKCSNVIDIDEIDSSTIKFIYFEDYNGNFNDSIVNNYKLLPGKYRISCDSLNTIYNDEYTTSSYEINFINADSAFIIYKRNIKIVTNDKNVFYNGYEDTKDFNFKAYKIDESGNIDLNSLAQAYGDEIKVNEELSKNIFIAKNIKNDSIENKLIFDIINSDGEDTSMFYNIIYEYGTLSVTTRLDEEVEITTPKDVVYKYNGLNHLVLDKDGYYSFSTEFEKENSKVKIIVKFTDDDIYLDEDFNNLASNNINSGKYYIKWNLNLITISINNEELSYDDSLISVDGSVINVYFTVEKRIIFIRGKNLTYTYDGLNHYITDYELIDHTSLTSEDDYNLVSIDEIGYVDKAMVEYDGYGDKDFINSKQINILSVTIYNSGVDVTSNYECYYNYNSVANRYSNAIANKLNKFKNKFITIINAKPRELEIKTGSAERQYNGEKLFFNDVFEIKNESILLPGHTVTKIDNEMYIIHVGSTKNAVKFKVTDEYGNDVSKFYIGKYLEGKLKITRVEITITTGSEEFIYDGIPHSNHTFACEGLLAGYRVEIADEAFKNSITDVGSISNSINKQYVNIYDINHNIVNSDFKITVIAGVLSVK